MRYVISRPLKKLGWATCSVGLICGCASGQHPLFRFMRPCEPSPYTVARESVYQPLARQANNGAILDQTVWNHHFEEGKAVLHSSGYHFLDRVARRSYGTMLQLHLQTTRDFDYEPRFRDKFDAFRQSLDAARARAVADYMKAAYPGVTFQLHVIEPSPIGMAGIEAAKAVSDVRDSARGTLPAELLKSIGSYLPSGGGGGGVETGPPPSPVTQGTGAPGSFGSEPPPAGMPPGGSDAAAPVEMPPTP